MAELSFADKRRNLAELAVRLGVNLQPGQHLTISAEPTDLELAREVVRIAYECGASYVDLIIHDPLRDAMQIALAPEDDRNFVPTYVTVRADQILDRKAARLGLRSQSEPQAFQGLNQQHVAAYSAAQMDAQRRLMIQGISGMRINWSLLGPPSPAWAAMVYPELDGQAAITALWEQIFSMTFADSPDCLNLWQEHLQRLRQRADALTRLQIRTLHFTGPGTDLRVGLSPDAVFLAGSKSTPDGIEFCPNIPTFEAYTTPDWRQTEGRVRLTRPAIINFMPVQDVELLFKGGEIVEVIGGKNIDAYRSLLDTDPGARRLGEVALVGTDSPIFRSGKIFYHTLYDENAACHIATGRAYAAALRNGQQRRRSDLEALGMNDSKTHQDVMISDEETTLVARCAGGGEVVLIERGAWTADFRF